MAVSRPPIPHRKKSTHHAFRNSLDLFTLTILLPAGALWPEPDIHDTRLLSQPAVTARHVAFIYADSLWIADIDGRTPGGSPAT